MDYISLSDFKWGWTFRHKELPVPDEALKSIKPLSKASANQYWRRVLSKEATHASHFMADDWPGKNGVWQPRQNWQHQWECGEPDLPAAVLEHCLWEGNTRIYFCYDMDHIVESTWGLFCRHWKNFVFFDDEPILIGKNRDQVVVFHSDGTFQVGHQPSK